MILKILEDLLEEDLNKAKYWVNLIQRMFILILY